MEKSLKYIVATLIILVTIAGSIIYVNYFILPGKSEKLTIFCAGSLSIPLDKLSSEFTKSRSGVEIHIEPSGSVMAVRKVTELGKKCDVMALADYRLIPLYMMPSHADFYIMFASNSIVLCYTNSSKYSEEITSENWYEILTRSDVKYGFSNPNDDPCGYRAVIVLTLASKYYNNSAILEKLIVENTNIDVEEINETTYLNIPENLEVKNNLVVRSKSVDLIALLESSALDYAFEYRSVAVQHNLSYIELPKQIDLSSIEYEDFYGTARVRLLYGTSNEREVSGSPIVYGVTIPFTVSNRDLAIEFLKMLLGDTGKRIFGECGQPFLEHPIGVGNVPEELRDLVVVSSEGS